MDGGALTVVVLWVMTHGREQDATWHAGQRYLAGTGRPCSAHAWQRPMRRVIGGELDGGDVGEGVVCDLERRV